jgi:hypothetical protein
MLNFKDFFENKLTLQYHEVLNPKLWKDNNLNPEVRKHLLKIAESWREFANIPKRCSQRCDVDWWKCKLQLHRTFRY